MKIRYAVLPLLVLCLTACGNKPPQCSDEKTVELVKRIFHNSLMEKQNEPGEDASLLEKMKQDVKLVVGTIRTAATDEKIGKVTCDAVIEAQLPTAAKAPLENPIFRNAMQRDPATRDLKVNGLVVSTEIQYTSQMTDDKKEHLVEMRGFKGIVDLVSALGNMGVFKAVSAIPTTSDSTTAAAPSAESEIATAKAAPKRSVAGVTLQAFECGDTCQLKYVDSNGNSQSAICTDTKGCQSWAEGPKGFMPLIGAKADLVIGKKYIPEGGVTMDNVVGISLADVDPPSSSK